MSDFQIMYACFGGFLTLSGIIMVITYSLTNPWWTNQLGRMMIAYAVAEILMSVLILTTVLFQFAPYWFRFAWFGLQTVIGSTFCYQTSVIIRLHRSKRREVPQ